MLRCSAALLLLQLRATVYGQMKMQKDAFMPGMGSDAEEDDIFKRRKLARMQSMQEMAGMHKKTEYGSKKQVEVRLDSAGWGRFKDGDKFLQENDSKRNRAEKKQLDEKKQKHIKEAEIIRLHGEVEKQKEKRGQMMEEVKKMSQ